MLLRILLLCLGLASARAFAHDEGPNMNVRQLEATLKLYQLAIELEPLIVEPSGKVEAASVLTIGGKKVYLNSHFHQLVKGWVRIYYQEIDRDCSMDQPLNESLLDNTLKDYAPQSFTMTKVAHPLMDRARFFAEAGASFGGSFGTVAMVIWVAGEVADDVLSAIIAPGVGGGGLHFLCSLNKAVAVGATRFVQKNYRMASFSSAFDRYGVTTYVRAAIVGMAVHRAQRRVQFELPPFEIDEHELEEVDEEGPNRFWGWVEGGKRLKYIERIQNKAAHSNESNEATWMKSMRKVTELSRKDFLGKRHKKFLLLKGRKRPNRNFLAGEGAMDQPLHHGVLWPLSVEENILGRALIAKETEFTYLEEMRAALPNYPPDEIRGGIAQSFSPNHEGAAQAFEKLLQDIERIFDPKVDRRLRYYQTLLIESVMAGFIYDLYDKQMDSLQPYSSGMWKAMKRHWASSGFVYYIYQYADFLRVAATEKDEVRLMKKKYQAMEGLMRIFHHLQNTQPQLDQKFDLAVWLQNVKDSNHQLRTFTPWQDKNMQFSWRALLQFPYKETFGGWVPFLPSRFPLCTDMDRIRK